MKKLFFFLLLAPMLLASCSSNDDDNNNTTYLDNKLIEGQWERLNGLDSTVYTFKNNRASEVTYDKYILTIVGDAQNYGQYKLTVDKIVFPQFSRPYKLSNDTLYIDEGGGIYVTPYTKVKR